jgi:dihydroorotase
MNLQIRGGRVVDPHSGNDQKLDLFIADGKIAGIGKAPADFTAKKIIDAKGLIVAPGLVDLATRLREPGNEYRATLESEIGAAVAGGVTSLACLPDTDPPLDEPGLVEMLKYRARTLNLARVYPVGALTQGLNGQRLTEMTQLVGAGCVAFSQADAAISDTQVLQRALQYAATFGYAVWLRPQDPYLSQGGVAHDGQVATRLGLPGIPVSAETVSLSTILLLVRETGARVHLCRLSSADAVEMVRQAKTLNLPISCDVSVNHLHLCDLDIGYFNSDCHLRPPLRSQRDRDALRKGLMDGTIDAICSDHTPVDEDDKQLPFGESEAGASGVELLLSLTLKWASETGVSLSDALRRVTLAPACVLGVAAGRIEAGAVADLCLFNPDAMWRVEPAQLKSQGKNTPFSGMDVPGRVEYTLVEGRVVFQAKTRREQ